MNILYNLGSDIISAYTKEQINKHIGETMYNWRNSCDCTLESLSEVIDVSPGFLGMIERNKRGLTIEKLVKFSQYSKLDLEEIVIPADIKGSNKNIEDISSEEFENLMKCFKDMEQRDRKFILKMSYLFASNELTEKQKEAFMQIFSSLSVLSK